MARASKRNGKWDIDPEKLGRALRIKAADVPRVVVLELGRRIVRRTPVQHPAFIPPGSPHPSGNLKANWRYGENLRNPQYDATSGTGAALGVEPTEFIAGLTAAVRSWRMGAAFSVLNVTPYGIIVEVGGYPPDPQRGSKNYETGGYEIRTEGGFSKQAPAGMVRVTINEFQGIVAAAARQERAKGLRV